MTVAFPLFEFANASGNLKRRRSAEPILNICSDWACLGGRIALGGFGICSFCSSICSSSVFCSAAVGSIIPPAPVVPLCLDSLWMGPFCSSSLLWNLFEFANWFFLIAFGVTSRTAIYVNCKKKTTKVTEYY